MSATDALTKLEHRKEIEAQVLKLIQDIPQTEILLSMPGIGPRSSADPHDCWRYVRLPRCSAPGILCRAITADESVRNVYHVEFA